MRASKPPSSQHTSRKDADSTAPASPPPTKAQIDFFYSLLHDFSETNSVRAQLHYLSTSVTGYCPTCTQPGACGQTCPLLCPPDAYLPRTLVDPVWPMILIHHAELWHALHKEMQLKMATASARQIRMWERTAKQLVEESMSELERKEAEGWKPDLLQFRVHRGMNGEWGWEKAWREDEEEVVDEAFAHDVMEPLGYWRKAERVLSRPKARSADEAGRKNDSTCTGQGQPQSSTFRGAIGYTANESSEKRKVPVVQVPRKSKRGRATDQSGIAKKRIRYE